MFAGKFVIIMKLKKHHKDKYGRNIPRRCDVDNTIETIRKHLIKTGNTRFELNGVLYELKDNKVHAHLRNGETIIL